MSDIASPTDEAALAARIAVLEAALTAERELRAAVEAERDRLREAYEALLRDVELPMSQGKCPREWINPSQGRDAPREQRRCA